MLDEKQDVQTAQEHGADREEVDRQDRLRLGILCRSTWTPRRPVQNLTLPEPARMRQQVAEQLAFMDAATDTHHCHGGKIIPFSMHNVDEVLADLDVNISAAVGAWHWLMPVDPAAYRRITPSVLHRLPRIPAAPVTATVPEAVPGRWPVVDSS